MTAPTATLLVSCPDQIDKDFSNSDYLYPCFTGYSRRKRQAAALKLHDESRTMGK